MEILVIDGQGGGLGRQLVAAVKKAVPQAVVTAIGTNSAATSAMMKAGADRAATGENAVVVGCRRADVILAGRLPELKRIGKPHKNPQKQNAENIPSPCWGTRYLLHIYHQSNIKLSSAIRCSMHQDVGRFCAAGPASCRSIDIIIV